MLREILDVCVIADFAPSRRSSGSYKESKGFEALTKVYIYVTINE